MQVKRHIEFVHLYSSWYGCRCKHTTINSHTHIDVNILLTCSVQSNNIGYRNSKLQVRVLNYKLEESDRLWSVYSNGKFGFSIQAKLLKSVGKKYELMWPKIGWKKEGLWTRYPGSFCWSLDAPDGHMPLINQLRGVRLMDSILRHPAIAERHNNIL